ncbi:MAG: hypothetical protein CBC49_008315 [Alphaproteobacteria bacterium TMED89]|nr:hypothetical protein [Rhodospirillaceae bacterium]RPH12364.1 MAG: hypothetical protein CBC49_008315 [Alphaproteobacteria bacterium TMED89]
MKKALFAGLCALALMGCEASDEPDAQPPSSASAPMAFSAQPTTPTGALSSASAVQRVAGVPVTLLVSSPQTTSQGAILGETELAQLLIGNSIKQVDDQYWAYFGANGQLGGLLVNLTERGSYSLAGGQVCKSWPTWAAGTRLCYRVLNLGDARYRFSGIGVDSFDVVISRGNPQAL